jgi:ribosome-binding factor A
MGLRQERLADEIRDVLAGCFAGGQLRDPRLEGVSITAVKLSGDLQVASVYFRIYGEATAASVQAIKGGLESAAGHLRKKLADSFEIRRVPTLRFFFDESIETGSRIEKLLAQRD